MAEFENSITRTELNLIRHIPEKRVAQGRGHGRGECTHRYPEGFRIPNSCVGKVIARANEWKEGEREEGDLFFQAHSFILTGFEYETSLLLGRGATYVSFLTHMLMELIRVWFGWVEAWGYVGIFTLMAMESSIIPVPSEIVMPPAAYWAAQGKMDFAGVVLAGTLGSYFGSILSYGFARAVGKPVIDRYGRYFFMAPAKVAMAEAWMRRFGAPGIFFARLLPVVRHLISIPAGILKMPVASFSIATTVGAGLWCWILAELGREVIGGQPDLLQSPAVMIAVIKNKLHWFVFAIAGLSLLYLLVLYFQRSAKAAAEVSASVK